jgi:hypothetical protein
MDHAHAISNLPKTKVAILPCCAHEPGFGEERVNVPNERRSRLAPVTTEGRLTGSIASSMQYWLA